MLTKQLFQVAGVDGCKAGWFVAITSATKRNTQPDSSLIFKLKNCLVVTNFTEVLSETIDCKLVCVDIPIGLSDGDQPRGCDVAARKLLRRPRASSIFPPPIRQCLEAEDYETVCQISQQHCGKRLSKQSFAIMDKIRQVDELMTPALQSRVREIHPEVSFWALNNKKPMQQNKKTSAGRKERMKLLNPIFPNIEKVVGEARKPNEAGPDDILDALVAAWTAGQVVLGKSKTLPENPDVDNKGLRMEIVYPA